MPEGWGEDPEQTPAWVRMAYHRTVVPERLQTSQGMKPKPKKPPTVGERVNDSDAGERLDFYRKHVPERLTAPPRSALLSVGPSPTPGPAPGPNPDKEKARADVKSMAMGAALAEHAREDPRGQGSNQKLPAPPGESGFVKGGVGTGAGAAGETPKTARPAAPAGDTSWPKWMKLPDGRVVSVNEPRAADYQAGGAQFTTHDEAMASGRLGAPQAARFMKDRTSGTMDGRQPYSEKVRALASQDAPDLSEEGGVGFGLGAPGSGGAIEGYRKLSGLEQSIERRRWLEGRADQEQANELARRGGEVQGMELERRALAAQQDPLELARIQAQGRMGGDVAKVEMDLAARRAAIDQFRATSQQIEAAQARLAMIPAGDPEAADLRGYLEYLERTRREMTNLMLGMRLSDPRQNELGSLLAALGGGAAAPTPGAG